MQRTSQASKCNPSPTHFRNNYIRYINENYSSQGKAWQSGKIFCREELEDITIVPVSKELKYNLNPL